jgi:FAD/FMN-containing dehydrogenase
LSSQLGPDNIQVIDKLPKDEGWYMEHPNTHDMMTVTPVDDFLASTVVYPGSTSEVQTIVLWANKNTIPLFPISMGRNLGYGGAAPRVRGSVVVDIGKRMNKILDIDPDDYTCLLEPGVSFYALYEEVQKRGYGDKLWIDTPDLGGGSVLGNTLDRGVGYTVSSLSNSIRDRVTDLYAAVRRPLGDAFRAGSRDANWRSRPNRHGRITRK